MATFLQILSQDYFGILRGLKDKIITKCIEPIESTESTESPNFVKNTNSSNEKIIFTDQKYYVLILFGIVCLFATETISHMISLIVPAIKTFYLLKNPNNNINRKIADENSEEFLDNNAYLCYWMLNGLFYGFGFLFSDLTIPFISILRIIFAYAMIQSNFLLAAKMFNLVSRFYDLWSNKHIFEEILEQVSTDLNLNLN
jgi:hypothetical protein